MALDKIVGASIVNTISVNAASYTIGSSFIANTTAVVSTGTVTVGNSTVNSIIHSTGITANGAGILSINATSIATGTLDTARLPATANISTAINVGANINLTTSSISIGNSTVNTSINSTAISTTSNTLTVGTAAYVVANGNVGIGTASPTDRLDIRFASGTGNLKAGISAGNNIKLFNTAGDLSIASSDSASDVILDSQRSVMFKTANTERMRVNAGAPILCLSGGSTTATGTGIAFPATQSASSDANTLDDYEEGTWTPAFTTSGGGFSSTYSTQLGTYVKVGRLVTVWVNILVGTKSASGSGYLQVSGLPFNIATGISEFGGSVGMSYLWSSNPCICIQPSAGTSTAILNYTFTNNNCSGANIANGCYFRATITYQSGT